MTRTDRFRIAVLAGATALVGSLAGCGGGDTADAPEPTDADPTAGSTTDRPATTDSPGGGTTDSTGGERDGPGTATVSSRRPTTLASTTSTPDAGTTAGGAATTPTTAPVASTTQPTTTRDCSAEVTRLENELATAEADLESAKTTRDFLERDVVEKRAIRNQYPGGFADATLSTARETCLAMRESVAHLELGLGSLATGWFVDADHLLTNSHNLDGVEGEITGWTVDGEEFACSEVGRVESKSPDVALLSTDHDGTPLPTGDSTALEPGDPLVQVGHPGAVGNWVHSLGLFLRRTETAPPDGDPVTDLVTSVPGRQGVSGSPLATLDGTVVGLTYGGQDRTTRARDEAPEPADPVVYDFSIAPEQWGVHVPVEDALAYYEEWS